MTRTPFNSGFNLTLPSEKYCIIKNDNYNWKIISNVIPTYQVLNNLSIQITLINSFSNQEIITLPSKSTEVIELWTSQLNYITLENTQIDNGHSYIADGPMKVFYKIYTSSPGQIIITSL